MAFSLLFVFSCSTVSNQQQPEKNQIENSSKIDKKKLAKEAAYLVAWDITWAATCKSGLHLSYGICLAVDTIGDVGIIAYSNFTPQTADGNETQKICDPQKQTCQQGEVKKKGWKDINPLELAASVGLMAVVLLFF